MGKKRSFVGKKGFAVYRAKGQLEKNQARKRLRHMKRHPNDAQGATSLGQGRAGHKNKGTNSTVPKSVRTARFLRKTPVLFFEKGRDALFNEIGDAIYSEHGLKALRRLEGFRSNTKAKEVKTAIGKLIRSRRAKLSRGETVKYQG